MKNILPHFVRGKVVKGFGRGSKSLGIPTANYEQSVVDQLPEALTKGIYYGFAQVDQSPVHPCSISLGWNPYFGNQVKSMVRNRSTKKKSTIIILIYCFKALIKFY